MRRGGGLGPQFESTIRTRFARVPQSPFPTRQRGGAVTTPPCSRAPSANADSRPGSAAGAAAPAPSPGPRTRIWRRSMPLKTRSRKRNRRSADGQLREPTQTNTDRIETLMDVPELRQAQCEPRIVATTSAAYTRPSDINDNDCTSSGCRAASKNIGAECARCAIRRFPIQASRHSLIRFTNWAVRYDKTHQIRNRAPASIWK